MARPGHALEQQVAAGEQGDQEPLDDHVLADDHRPHPLAHRPDEVVASGISHGLWTFLRTYLLRRGFLDGREGFLLAVANAEGTYYQYMKAWLASWRRD